MARKSKNKLCKKYFSRLFVDFKRELREHRLIYFLLTLSLIGGLFIRTYRTDQILGFYFDQGRDALKIWEFWHNFDIMLIGPTTGIAGIFRGPFYFYLIAPAYLLSGGNPLGPSYFLSFLSMIAVVIIYYLGVKIQDRWTGLFAAILASFSFYIMVASRWLSNPTPMLLLSVLLIWMMTLVNQGKKWAWIVIALIVGLSQFHFGGSGEVFYFFGLGVFFVWQLKKNKWKFGKVLDLKTVILAGLAFLFTLSPLIIFEFAKGNQLSTNIKEFLAKEETFKSSLWEVAQIRLDFYYGVFTSKIFHWIRRRELILLIAVGVLFLAFLPRLIKSDSVKIILIMLLSPLIGFLFFQGNQGNVYDYYLTGYFMIFILLFAIVLGQLWNYKLGKLFVLFFFYVFLSWNGMITRNRLIAGVDGPNTVVFGNQKQAIEWIYEDAEGRDFNVDVYVPPVIPYAYDYLFTWYGNSVYDKSPVEEQVELLYTLYEVDPPHPERLQAWLDRQAGIGEVKQTERFGGITIDRRVRIGDGQD